MRNIKPNDTNVQFPKKEKAYALLPSEHTPFLYATVGITYPDPAYHIDRSEGHEINVFEYVMEGEGEIFLCGVWKKVTAGSLYILRSGEEHHYRSSPKNPWKKRWINYGADYLAPLLDAYGISSGVYPAPDAEAYFAEAMETLQFGTPPAEAGRILSDCIHKLISLAAATLEPEQESDAYRIRTRLDAALYRKLELNELARSLHISKSNLIRIFKKRYGVTPYEYLLAAKIEAAKALLSGTQLPIKEIAERLHISDAHYFSTLFEKRAGLCPRDWRRRTNPSAFSEKTSQTS